MFACPAVRVVRHIALGVLAFALTVASPSSAGAADAPNIINLQGFLRTNAGTGLDGNVALTVRFYAAQTGGSALHTEVLSAVTVADGRFKVQLGSGTALPTDLFSARSDVWVGMSVDGGAELPRRKLASAPYALNSTRASSAAAADTAAVAEDLTCTGCVGTADIADANVTAAKLATDVTAAFVNANGDTMTGELTASAGVDFDQQQARNLRFHNAATAPVACSASTIASVYFNTGDSRLYVCSGTAWIPLTSGTNAADEDGDGVPNSGDNCLTVANADQNDTDSDGAGDACDTDDDGDGVLDGSDNCPRSSNAAQTDTDSDGAGDACDTDDDNDGVLDVSDNCALVANADQVDLDGDGQGNACDADDDGDGVGDGSDNCPLAPNASQTDTDSDGDGDACDTDDDGDGDLDNAVNCPLVANADQLDTDADGTGDACDTDDDNDGALDGADCAPLDSGVYPGATETCDGVDDDCDGSTDEGEDLTGCVAYWVDSDDDGYGSGSSKCYCGVTGSYDATTGGDCNDAAAGVNPGASESCNSVDDNCDGSTDEGGVCAGCRKPSTMAGQNTACGIRADKTIACWGTDNAQGQLNAPSGTYKQLEMGNATVCALNTAGTPVCWGNTGCSILTVPSGTFKQIAMGTFQACGVKTDGSAVCWGCTSGTPPSGTFNKVDGADGFSCGLKTDGSMACWGGSTYNKNVAPSGTFVDFDISGQSGCALRADNTFACWGDSQYGQANAPSGSFNQMIDMKGAGFAALKSDGSIVRWGNNSGANQTGPYASGGGFGGSGLCTITSGGVGNCTVGHTWSGYQTVVNTFPGGSWWVPTTDTDADGWCDDVNEVTYTVQNVATNDGWASTSGSSYYRPTDEDLLAGAQYGGTGAWLIFDNTSALAGKTITAAHLEIEEASNSSGNNATVEILAVELASPTYPGSPSAFQSLIANNATAARVQWSGDLPEGVNNTPDISAVLQELVDTVTPNKVMIIIRGISGGHHRYGTVETDQGSASQPAKLVVTYE